MTMRERVRFAGGAGLCPSAAEQARKVKQTKEGAHGETLGSPVLMKGVVWQSSSG
jgi:hypothetical protein